MILRQTDKIKKASDKKKHNYEEAAVRDCQLHSSARVCSLLLGKIFYLFILFEQNRDTGLKR